MLLDLLPLLAEDEEGTPRGGGRQYPALPPLDVLERLIRPKRPLPPTDPRRIDDDETALAVLGAI